MPVIDTAETDIKERMSVGLVTLVAARAGCEVSETKVDRVSRDITITPISGLPVSVDAQLKATVNLIDSGDHLKYDLDVKNYNDLRQTNVGNARILIVLHLHQNNVQWLRTNSVDTRLDHCAYWVSLHGEPDTNNNKKIRIKLPKDQIFSPQGLEDILQRRYNKIQANHGGL